MDNFKAIYKLLLALERSMDLPAFDIDALHGGAPASLSGNSARRGPYQKRRLIHQRDRRPLSQELAQNTDHA